MLGNVFGTLFDVAVQIDESEYRLRVALSDGPIEKNKSVRVNEGLSSWPKEKIAMDFAN
jgi:hypothetical protein